MTSFTELVDLAADRVGGVALVASDEFFAPKECLLQPGRGIFIPDKYTEYGKWMDGWETRRKRTPGHDWCIIKLGLPGLIRGIDVDTNHFLGNFPEHCSLAACHRDDNPSLELLLGGRTRWTEILPISRLLGGVQNLFPVDSPKRWTHVRLHIYPDGGVARLRVHGEVVPDWERLQKSRQYVDLAAVENGGVVLVANDMFFGPKDNLIMPGRAATMGEGWETKRKRGPGHDWVIIRLGAPGVIKRIEVDTNHFKGNFPESCSLEGCWADGVPPDFSTSRSIEWTEILPRSPLQGHTLHSFAKELQAAPPFTHVRFNIYPDGGVSRLRLFGTLRKGKS